MAVASPIPAGAISAGNLVSLSQTGSDPHAVIGGGITAALTVTAAVSEGHTVWSPFEDRADDLRWQELLADPDTPLLLERLAAKALEEFEAGLTRDLDELL